MSNLKNERNKKNISQVKLADMSNVNLRTIQNYEQGFKDVNKAQAITIYKLSQSLGCRMEDLLELDK